jgi:plasmid stabilization system protein ParE
VIGQPSAVTAPPAQAVPVSAQRPAAPSARQGLRRYTGPAAQPDAAERCSLCGTRVPEEHRHLVDPAKRSLECACTACAMLFDQPGAGAGRLRTVPRRYLTDRGHAVDRAAWDRLQIPVGVVFLFHDTALDRMVGFYPSPAGATQSELDPAELAAVGQCTRLAEALEPDVEALLVRRTPEGYACYLVPIDVCYELVGRMRLHWRGFDGGSTARAELEEFFADVERQAKNIDAGSPVR